MIPTELKGEKCSSTFPNPKGLGLRESGGVSIPLKDEPKKDGGPWQFGPNDEQPVRECFVSWFSGGGVYIK